MNEEVRRREPVLNAPWPAVVLVAVIVGSYLLQSLVGGQAAVRYGFTPADLDRGLFSTLVTHQFLHGGWAHVGFNAAFALAMGPPVSRLLGQGARGALAFFAFYLLCGVIGALGYAAFHPHQADSFLIGASGAVSGLFGAATRLIGRQELAPLTDRRVLGMAAIILILDVVLGLIGFAPGMPGPVTIAWEAHLAGYLAGLLLIGPLARLLRRA